jgi:predicted Rossmann-fold nucleotide-binding protein
VGQPESYQKCYDGRVYRHYLKKGKRAEDIKETLARALHDHSISDCMHEFLDHYDERQVVGVMGGHALQRTNPAYARIVSLSKRLTEEGYLMVTGGGPGAMEATHLGAWMAGRTDEETDKALDMMRSAPAYTDEGWLDTAFEVRRQFPQHDYHSLGIPTWLYGHEPSTPLATHIAKFFENSIREDSILNIARGGIIFTPGSAGTLQEVFQAAVPNHYLSYGYSSPMIFMDKEFWTKEVPIWPLLLDLMERQKYKNLLLTLSDSENEIVSTIMAFHEGAKEQEGKTED